MSQEGIVTPMVHSRSSSSSKPVLSLPKTTATLPLVRESAREANSSGKSSLFMRFFPRRLVVPAAQTQSAVASVMEE